MERPKLLDPEEDRRRRERRHREREARHRDGKSSRSRRGNNYKLDIIDKLDVTGIYGPGCTSPLSLFLSLSFFLSEWSLSLLPRLEYNGAISAH